MIMRGTGAAGLVAIGIPGRTGGATVCPGTTGTVGRGGAGVALAAEAVATGTTTGGGACG
jgi:hypothetical protein